MLYQMDGSLLGGGMSLTNPTGGRYKATYNERGRLANCKLIHLFFHQLMTKCINCIVAGDVQHRAAGIARLPRSMPDPESFPHTAYVKILATLARKTVN